MNDNRLNVAVTIDVEEEGLFSGSYSSGITSSTNVKHLWRLDPIFSEFGIRPVLLVSYQVARNHECKQILSRFQSRWNAEIGAHLHHWNTEPLYELDVRQPVPSELIPKGILESKMKNLTRELADLSGTRPLSFRMGRFNLGPKMFSIVEAMGFMVDSSIEPLRSEYGGPDHLMAPSDPYYPDPANPVKTGTSRVLEAPVTINAAFGNAGALLERSRSLGIIRNDRIMNLAASMVSIPAQPAWVGLNASKAGVMFHTMKGGRFLTIFFHSSELAPGLNPLHPTEEAVHKFLRKLKRFFRWLVEKYDTRFVTLGEFPSLIRHD